MYNFIVERLIMFSVAAKDPCSGNGFFGLPHWYKYLGSSDPAKCSPTLTSINDIWLIFLAIIEILLRVAVAVAIAFIIVGGIKFITSRANPDKTSQAKNTVTDALVGLVIAIAAVAIVSFLAGRFSE